jgi:hypothetical protein
VQGSYLVQKLAHDGKVPMTVVREGKTLTVAVPVPVREPMLLEETAGGYPSYFVYGVLAFTEGNSLFLSTLTGGKNGGSYLAAEVSRGNPLTTRAGDKEAFPGERLVVVSSPFFPHKLATGYSSPFAACVKTVNGIPIKNLAHLVAVLRDCHDEFVTFDFYGRGAEALVFPRAAMVSATEEILTDNGVRSQGSPDMMSVWNHKETETAKGD